MSPAALILWLLGALALCTPVVIYFKWKTEAQRMGDTTAARTARQFAIMSDQLASLDSRLDDLEANSSRHADWVAQADSLNLNRRGQVLRLHGRGESVSGIASALRLSRGEVQLIIKVHEFAWSGIVDN